MAWHGMACYMNEHEKVGEEDRAAGVNPFETGKPRFFPFLPPHYKLGANSNIFLLRDTR